MRFRVLGVGPTNDRSSRCEDSVSLSLVYGGLSSFLLLFDVIAATVTFAHESCTMGIILSIAIKLFSASVITNTIVIVVIVMTIRVAT